MTNANTGMSIDIEQIKPELKENNLDIKLNLTVYRVTITFGHSSQPVVFDVKPEQADQLLRELDDVLSSYYARKYKVKADQ